MKNADIKDNLDKLSLQINKVINQEALPLYNDMLNIVQTMYRENIQLKLDYQNAKDEINKLKGEQGKPQIRPQSPNKENQDHSSEKNRKRNNDNKDKKPKMKKQETVSIDEKIECKVDVNTLPKDAVFKGYSKRIVQDIAINTHNIELLLETYYSPSQNKTYTAEKPKWYNGEFGVSLKALIISCYRVYGMTVSAIDSFCKTFGIYIAQSSISRILTENHDVWHQEKQDIVKAGLRSTPYQHIDDTGCKEHGKNQYTHIIGNLHYSAYFTKPRKDRLTLLKTLSIEELKYQMNKFSYALMELLGVAKKHIKAVKGICRKKIMSEKEFDDFLGLLFPDKNKNKKTQAKIKEAAALVDYYKNAYSIKYLMCDDAPQFEKIAKFKCLCWIHEGRHYKKLIPVFTTHKDLLDEFINKFWIYYHKLLDYKISPSAELDQELSEEFDSLFATKTGYEELDERITLTAAKKESLLLVLSYPFLPIENNLAELAARVQARIRDVNLHTMSESGTKAKDTFATIVQTAKKLNVNIYQYLYDRISQSFNMTSLADLITIRSSP